MRALPFAAQAIGVPMHCCRLFAPCIAVVCLRRCLAASSVWTIIVVAAHKHACAVPGPRATRSLSNPPFVPVCTVARGLPCNAGVPAAGPGRRFQNHCQRLAGLRLPRTAARQLTAISAALFCPCWSRRWLKHHIGCSAVVVAPASVRRRVRVTCRTTPVGRRCSSARPTQITARPRSSR